MNWFKILRYVILIALITLALTRIWPHIHDFSQLVALKNRIEYPFILAAIATQMTQYLGDGWLSQVLLGILNVRVSIRNSFRIASLNVFAAHLLPVGEAGAVAAAYHFYKKLGVDTDKFIFLTICWGAVTYFLLLLMLLLPLIFLPDLPIHPPHIAFTIKTISIVTILLLFVFVLYLTRRLFINRIKLLLGNQGWAKDVVLFVKNRSEYQRLLVHRPKDVTLALLAGTIYYASNVGTLAFSFMAFHTLPSIPLLIFAYAASLLFGRVSFAPGGFGATEASLILLFVESGVDANVTLAAVLVYRLISFWLPIPFGLFSYLSLSRKDRKTVELDL